MHCSPGECPPFRRFTAIELLADLPALQDPRPPRDGPPAVAVEPYWYGMVEQVFRQESNDGYRIREGGCMMLWLPRNYADSTEFVVASGLTNWDLLESLAQGSTDLALCFRSYAYQGVPTIPPEQFVEALRFCNEWNLANGWPTAMVVKLPVATEYSLLEVVLSAHLRVAHGTFQAQVNRFFWDCQEGAERFWNDFLAQWSAERAAIQ